MNKWRPALAQAAWASVLSPAKNANPKTKWKEKHIEKLLRTKTSSSKSPSPYYLLQNHQQTKHTHPQTPQPANPPPLTYQPRPSPGEVGWVPRLWPPTLPRQLRSDPATSRLRFGLRWFGRAVRVRGGRVALSGTWFGQKTSIIGGLYQVAWWSIW